MFEPDFRGIGEKIRRAGEDCESLQAYITEVFREEPNCPSIGVKFQTDTQEHVVYVSRMPDHMETTLMRVGVRLGEIVHNLRSSLDHLVYQLALKNNDGTLVDFQERRTQFPIEDKPTTFERRCTPPPARPGDGWIADLHADDQAVIKRFQVFNRVDESRRLPYVHPLAILRDLSNADKHRVVPTVGALPTVIEGVHIEAGAIIGRHMERVLRPRRARRTARHSRPLR